MDKYGAPERTDYKLIVENLSSRVSWQVSRLGIASLFICFMFVPGWTCSYYLLFGFALSTSPVATESLTILALANLFSKRRHGFGT